MEKRSFGSFVSQRGRPGGGGGAGEGIMRGSDEAEEKRRFEFQGMRSGSSVDGRGVMMRGAKWVPKGWLLVCVMVCGLLGFWVLIGSSYYSTDSGFFWMSRTQRHENEAAFQNLDEISIALLKLGLPLSAYALSMQNARTQSDSLSSPGSGIAASSDRHPVMTTETQNETVIVNVNDDHGRELRIPDESRRGENDSGTSELSIYNVANTYNYAQQVWVFHNVCHNGSHLMRFESEGCREPEDAAPEGLLKPIFCTDGNLYEQRLALMGKETGIPMAITSASWMTSHPASSVVWRNETVALLNLGRDTADPARFLQKVNMLLLLNNASGTAAFSDRVESFLFVSHQSVTNILHDEHTSFHSTYLSTILSRALPLDEEKKELGGIFHVGPNGNAAAADGSSSTRVQLNDPFSAASEESPLCFRKAVMTGTLKGSCWPGGEVVADMVREQLNEKFGTKSVSRTSEDWPYLVSILGNSTRRTLSSSSEEGFQALLNKKTMGLEVVHSLDFDLMDFEHQFEALQMADIVTGFYAPELALPALFCRKMTILVEIFPFKVQGRAHETQALDSGLIYMAHQIDEGIRQDELDEDFSLFQNRTASACMTNTKCKLYYATVRKVELTSKDLSQLQRLISLARLISSEMIAQKLTSRENIHQASSFLVQNLIGGRGKCKPFFPTEVPSEFCGNNWISFTGENQGQVTCCY